MGRQIVFDLEGDSLLQNISKIWIFVAYDIKTKEFFVFSDYDVDAKPMSELPAFLDNCTALIGHNILKYDLLVLEKLLRWRPKPDVRLIDTLIMSQVQNYKRFGFGHSLKRFGEFFEFPKVEHEDWSKYSKEMKNRCITDVKLNVKVFNYLLEELNSRKSKELLSIGLRAEHGAAYFMGRAELHGWPFDRKKAETLLEKLSNRLDEIKAIIEPKLKLKIKAKDKDPEFKKPTWTKTGDYAVRTASWFEIDPSRGHQTDRPIWGDYCRVEIVKPDMGSIESVKEYLYSIGWKPDEFNYVKDKKTGRPVPSSPKLTEASMEPLGEDGKLISEFYTVRSRYSVVYTWLNENLTSEDRVHGDSFTIGTPTGRMRHEIIANIPSKGAVFGEEVRSLFKALPGYKMVGADSKSNQNRGLCFYLDNEDYTKQVLDRDIHIVNAEVLSKFIPEFDPTSKKISKPFFYALIFGAGDGKLGLILTGKRDLLYGREARDKFQKNIPGFDPLVKKLSVIYEKSGNKYIFGLDGRPLFCESSHKLLNYALQCFEKVTVALAVNDLMYELDTKGFDWQPLIVYHDEVQFMVREDQAEEAAAIAKRVFRDSPKKIGVQIMDGDAEIGDNWAETH